MPQLHNVEIDQTELEKIFYYLDRIKFGQQPLDPNTLWYILRIETFIETLSLKSKPITK